LREKRETCSRELKEAETAFVRASQELVYAAAAAETGATAYRLASTELDAWLAGFGEKTGQTPDRAALWLLLSKEEDWIRNERSSLGAVEKAVAEAEGACAVHKMNLERHLAARSTPDDEATVADDLLRLRSTMTESEKVCDAARTALQIDDGRIAARVAISRELEIKRAGSAPWAKLNELIGSADGAKFRTIAQRRTLDILLGYANAHLYQIAPRYVIQRLPESLNLIVLDRDMGDERRSVHTLSGGETFLVSLALALGLASLTSNRLRIESLFIDEGFGSLDPETLNTAMGALMSLEAQGRKVGIISHLPEMADAIPVQIRIVKGRDGASRIVVPGAWTA
jgi:DNA repair protein SbcC/Rad50